MTNKFNTDTISNKEITLAILGFILVLGITFGSLFIEPWRDFVAKISSNNPFTIFIPGIFSSLIYVGILKWYFNREVK